MGKHLASFQEYIQLNEAIDISFFRRFPILRRLITDPFMLKINIPLIKLLNSDLDNEVSWQDSYRKIFRHACLKFGGGRKPDINTTCNKGKALMGLMKYVFDPDRGLIKKKDIDKWVDMTVKDTDPEKKPKRWKYTSQQIDEMTMKFVDVLERTKVKPADIKEIGTYLLTMALPIMAKFYKKIDLEKMKMITSNKLITPSVGREMVSSEPKPEPGKEQSGEISIY